MEEEKIIKIDKEYANDSNRQNMPIFKGDVFFADLNPVVGLETAESDRSWSFRTTSETDTARLSWPLSRAIPTRRICRHTSAWKPQRAACCPALW